MRSKIELLQLLKSCVNRACNILGLCSEVGELYSSERITLVEFSALDELIHEMRPVKCKTAYYWAKGLKNPRIRAINNLIKTLQDEK